MRRMLVTLAVLPMLATGALVATSPAAVADVVTNTNSCEQTLPVATGPHSVSAGRVRITVPGSGPSCTAATSIGVGSQGGYVEVDQSIEIDATSGDLGLVATPHSQQCGLRGCVQPAIGEHLACTASPSPFYGNLDYCTATSRQVVHVPATNFVTLSEACAWNGAPNARATNVHIKCSVTLTSPAPAP